MADLLYLCWVLPTLCCTTDCDSNMFKPLGLRINCFFCWDYLLFWVWPPHIMAIPPLLRTDMPCILMTSMSWWIFLCLLMEMYNTLFFSPLFSLSWFTEVVEYVPTILDVKVFFSRRICQDPLEKSSATNDKEGAIQVYISLCTTPKHWGLSTPFAVMSRKGTVGETKIERLQTKGTYMYHCMPRRPNACRKCETPGQSWMAHGSSPV